MYILLHVTKFDENGNYHMEAETDLPDNETVLKVLKDTVHTMSVGSRDDEVAASTYTRDDL